MPDRTRKQLKRYIRHLANQMGLKDWVIHLSKDPCASGASADIQVWYGSRVATIRMDNGWKAQGEDDLRTTITHELTHCHINHVWNAIDNIESAIGKPMYNQLHNSVRDHIEFSTDAISTAWAKKLPLMIDVKGKY